MFGIIREYLSSYKWAFIALTIVALFMILQYYMIYLPGEVKRLEEEHRVDKKTEEVTKRFQKILRDEVQRRIDEVDNTFYDYNTTYWM